MAKLTSSTKKETTDVDVEVVTPEELERLTDPHAEAEEVTLDTEYFPPADDAGEQAPIQIDADSQRAEAKALKMVAVRPRRTVMHTRIGGQWFNFVEGREVMVPAHVRDWLYEKKVL
jgi:hypothetical protein